MPFVKVCRTFFAAMVLAAVCACCPTAVRGNEPLAVTVIRDFVPPEFAIDLPDLRLCSADRLKTKLPVDRSGRVSVVATEGDPFLAEAFRKDRGTDLQRRQGTTSTRVIAIEGGTLTLGQIVDRLSDATLVTRNQGVVTLRLPLLIRPGATLLIDGDETPVLRLSTERGAFLANAGSLFIVDSQVTSWNESAGQPSPFVDKEQFRPFLASYLGSQTYLVGSRFEHLGYAAANSYGVSLSSQPERRHAEPDEACPTGAIIDCEFHGLYYGFYSFEARDVAIVNNLYDDCIVYGIDPHDRSTRLLIAKNEIRGTRLRHGIIGSRGVSSSLIFDNHTHDNAGSGIMLDRHCTGNVIIRNRIHDNEQGIALYESFDNRIQGNTIARNNKSGLRIRNSVRCTACDNTLVGHNDYALEVSARRLENHDERLAEGDYYEANLEVAFYRNLVTSNRGLAKATGLGLLQLWDIQTDMDQEMRDRLKKTTGPMALYKENDHKFGSDLQPLGDSLQALFDLDTPLLRVELLRERN